MDVVALIGGQVDLQQRTVIRGEHRFELRAKEVELLRYLASRPGRTVPREELFSAVWGYHRGTRSRTLDTTIRRLRAAIEADPADPRQLLTEVGVGYRFLAADGSGACTRFLNAGAERVRAALARRQPGRVVLCGPPGVGKRRWATEAAAGFAGRVVRGAPPDRSGDEAGNDGGIGAIALALGLDPRGDPARVRRRIEAVRARSPVLLVLDQAPPDELLAWAPPVLSWSVAPPPPDPGYEVVLVDPLPPDAARELLLDRARVSGADPGDADVDALLDQLGGVPLAIELAAGQLGFGAPADLARALAVHPERLFAATSDSVARAALVARMYLDPPARSALDAVAHFAGPVPVAVMAAAAGGVPQLARLRDLGWLVAQDRGWKVPTSLRFGADPLARGRAAHALVAAYADRCDPVCGPVSWDVWLELGGLVPTLRALGDDPRVRVLLAWGLTAAGAIPQAAQVANTLRDQAPLVYGLLGADPLDRRLAAVEGAPESVARDALLLKLYRNAGRLDAAAAVPDPADPVGAAAGEVWFQRQQLWAARSDLPTAAECARMSVQCWRGLPLLLERGVGAVAFLAMLLGQGDRAAREYAALARSPNPGVAVDGVLGLGFVALGRLDAPGAGAAADGGAERVAALGDALAVSVWHQVAQLRRETGDVEGVARAVIEGLRLAELSGGPAMFEAGLHGLLGTAWVDAGRYDEAIVELLVSAEGLSRLGLDQRRRYAELMVLIAEELAGRPVDAGWSAIVAELPGADGDRVHQLAALYAGRPAPGAADLARRNGDAALAGVIDGMAGRPLSDAVLACSFEARLAARLYRRRCHTGSHVPPSLRD